jgi:hypothetical protein
VLTTASGLGNWHTARTEPDEGEGKTYSMHPRAGPDFCMENRKGRFPNGRVAMCARAGSLGWHYCTF